MTKNFTIMTEVTCDLPVDYVKENNIKLMPLTYTLDGIDYDGTLENSLSSKDFYSKLRNGSMANTAQISPSVATAYFEEELKKGNDILYIGFSSGLTGGYQSIMIAKNELGEKYPDLKIMTIDSLCASLGQGLIVDYAVNLKNKGNSLEEVYDATEKIKLNICHYFTVDDLKHLYRGGRVSKTAAFIGTLLGIKPVMHVNNDGKLIPFGKVRGRKQSLNELVSKMGTKLGSYKNDYVFISHGDSLEDAQYVANQVKEKYGIDTKIINPIGAVIGTHSGPATIALFFIGENRDEKPM